MTTETTTGTTTGTRADSTRSTAASHRWAWWGVAAGILGVVATILTLVNAPGSPPTSADMAHLSSGTYHLGGAVGYLAVAALLVTAGAWRARVIPSLAPTSIAARVVADGLTASAAALALGYGWKLAMGLYLPGGANAGQFDRSGLFVYFVLNDFGPFIGWLGVVVAAAAMTVLGLRERGVPRWIGVVSALPVVVVLIASLGAGVAGFPGIVGPLWMIVTFAGLALSRTAGRVAGGGLGRQD